MTRAIAGAFATSSRPSGTRVAAALSDGGAQQPCALEIGALVLAFTGDAGAPSASCGSRVGLPPAAAPPATSGAVVCVLSGCLDNRAKLARQLGLIAGASDEQLLAHGYQRWGRDLLERLRGDFALVLWDRARAEGLLARDQIGVRCMYVCEQGSVLYFATEIHQLLQLLPRRPGPDATGLTHWLAASPRVDAGTLYEGVRKVQPAGLLAFGDGVIREHRYWTPRFVEPAIQSIDDSAEQVGEALSRATGARVDGAGRTGVLMSGGLDSAAVAVVASEAGETTALSAVFPEHAAVDESVLIDALLRELRVPALRAEVSPGGLIASALESQQRWQLPLLSWGDFWTLPLLRHAAAAGVRTVLGGDGGDELFATRAYLLADRLRAGDLGTAIALTKALPGAAAGPPRRALLAALLDFGVLGALPAAAHSPLARLRERRALPRWLRPAAARRLHGGGQAVAWKRLAGPRNWAHLAHALADGVEATGVLELLRHRAELAGLQARHPLLDLDLVELVLALPARHSFDARRNRPVLRAAMAGRLPDAVRLRGRKARFDTLVIDTLAGPDGPALRALLLGSRTELAALVDVAAVRTELFGARHAGSPAPLQWMQSAWRLATAELWLRMQADPAAPVSLPGASPSTARVQLRPHLFPPFASRQLDYAPNVASVSGGFAPGGRATHRRASHPQTKERLR